jgi:nucleoid-associated protein YgaU
MTKKQLIAKCTDLGIDSSGLDTNTQLEAAIATKETELAAMDVKAEADKVEADKAEAGKAETAKVEADKVEAEKVAANAKKAEAKKAAAEAKKEPAFYEDKRGRKWIFKPTAPKKLNIDGHPMSQEEILETEEVVSELVYGNCAFLTQKL